MSKSNNEKTILSLFSGMNIQQILWIITIIVTMGIQWGIYSTRLNTLKEDAIPDLIKKVEDQRKDIETLKIENGILRTEINNLKDSMRKLK